MAEAARDQNHVTSALGVSSSDATLTLPFLVDPLTGRLLTDQSGGGTGDVVGPASATDNAVARFDGATGKLIQNSTVIIADTTGNISGLQQITVGVASGATGKILIKGVTSGTITLQSASDAGTYTLTLPTDDGTPNQFLQTDGSGVLVWATPSGTGDVVGPASATDNAVARFDSTTGKLIQNSAVTIADTSGDITGGKYNGLTISTSTGTLTIANGKVLTFSNTLTFTGTDNSSVAFGTGGTVLYTASTIPLTVGSTTIASGTSTRILYDNAGVLGEYTLTGSGTVVAMQTAPTFATSITTPSVLATANDSGALGASGTAFADLFLASGAVINFAAANVTLTHSSGILTQNAGELRITSANVGTNADSVPTLSSTSTLTNKTLTAPTLGGATSLADGATIKLIVPTVDGTATGPTTAAFVSGYTSSAIGDLVYLDSSSKWQKTDSDALATTTGLLGIALAVAATDAALLVALPGSIVYATAFPTLTIGAPYYVGETAGTIQATIPTGADNAVRVVGFGVHADKLFFLPSSDTSTTVA